MSDLSKHKKIKGILTRDVKPFKTVPLRRAGFSMGLSYCVAMPLSILTYSLLDSLGIPNDKVLIVLPVVLTYLIYRLWLSYAKSISSKGKAR